MIPTSMAYCRGSVIQVPLKIPNAQRTPGECKWEEIALQNNMKASPLSFHVSSANHTASLKLSLIPSFSPKLIFKSLTLEDSQKPRQWCYVVLVNSEEQGQQESISWLSVFGKWKTPTTCKPFSDGGDPLTPSHLYPPEKPTCETAGRTGWPSCPWEMETSWLHGDQLLQCYTPGSDSPSQRWCSY